MGSSCRIGCSLHVVRRALVRVRCAELVAHHREGQPGGIPLARQQARESAGGGDTVDASQGSELLADQEARRLLLVGGVEVVERGAGGLVVDTLAAQLLGQSPASQPAAALAALYPRPREGAVVDQSDLGEA